MLYFTALIISNEKNAITYILSYPEKNGLSLMTVAKEIMKSKAEELSRNVWHKIGSKKVIQA